MNSKVLYTNNGNLEKQIKQKKIIPYMIFPNEKYKNNKWYYSLFYNIVFKVLNVEYRQDGTIDMAEIITDDGNYSVISTDLCDIEDYSISKDRRNIYKINIVNHEESFTGAEIIYWFFINDIDSFNKKFQGFWKYVDRYSIDRISDRDRYFVRAKLIGDKYVECAIIKDTTKSDYKKIVMDKMYNLDSDKFMSELKKKDLHRIQDIHRNDYL